ncbi:MAG TPA: inositol monophosphatase family protein [Acidimicrobiia bacterium]|jgi:myo-inositol-1(or 4)-monophosphatase|nr:inositol monophosphatase family protein [Acidimicrobiia bacterium]
MNDLQVATHAARAAGAIVAEGFGRHRTTDFKRRNDPVTDVDRAAEAAITAVLAEHRPDDSVQGEEGTAISGGDRTWVIDPLDGTVNFVHGLPIVSVSVALYAGDTPMVGVVHDPLRDETFSAVTGAGATVDDEPIHVSATSDLEHALVVTGFPYDHHVHPAAYVRTIEGMLAEVNGIRRLGSAALDLCYVAAGRIDAYWEYNLNSWDIAAGLLILTEAGGVATTPSGSPMTLHDPHLVVANPAIHERIRSIVDRTMPEHLRS